MQFNLDIPQLARDIHQNAIDHGFSEPSKRRPLDEHIALLHSEISELLEEYREHHDVEDRIAVSGKPLGVPSEAADIFIRALDFAAEYGLEDKLKPNLEFSDNVVIKQRVTRYVSDMHSAVTRIYTMYPEAFKPHIENLIHIVLLFCVDYGIDFESILVKKMRYNIGRPVKHGKAF